MATKKAVKPAVKKAKPKAPVAANPVGRPTKYKPEYAEQARKLCLLGYTDAELADFFNVSTDTINEWKVVHPEFSVSICKGKVIADADIAESLYHRAKGYSHPEDDIRTLAVGGGQSEIVITPTIKHYPPDTTAASLWLRNRQGGRWRDKQELEHSGSVSLFDEEQTKRMAALMNG